MAHQSDSEGDRHEKTLREANWQILAAPYFCVREIRELLIFSVLNLDGDTEHARELLDQVLQVEARLLRRCLSEDRQRTLDELALNRLGSWWEVVDYLRLADDRLTAQQISDLLPLCKRLCEKLRPDLD